ncbi:Acetaldehyde dehydrogenase [Trichinella spiralis]|uniref:Acetaldehyde dehydrogenase n=1 Tax=Trichinella spiralis TaxID=6334 RepID=A0ABR3KBG1_TRISP
MEPVSGKTSKRLTSRFSNANKFTGESSSTVGPFNADIDRLGRSSEQRAGERCREATRKTVILMNGDKPGLAEPTGRSSSLPVSPWAAPEKN